MQARRLLLFDPSPGKCSQHAAPSSAPHFANSVWGLCFAYGMVEGD